jgi:uncharacterized protein YegP (UPF0339 family)
MKFLIHKTRRKQPWYYTLVANNNEVLMTSENFNNRDDIIDSIASIKSGVLEASIEDAPIKSRKK